jgi:hypothetical protein
MEQHVAESTRLKLAKWPKLEDRFGHGRHGVVYRRGGVLCELVPRTSGLLFWGLGLGILLRFDILGDGSLGHAFFGAQQILEDGCLDIDGPVDDGQLLAEKAQLLIDSTVWMPCGNVGFL